MTKEELEVALSNADFWIQIFAVLVAIGIVGEVAFGIRHWLLNKQLHRLEETEERDRQAELVRLTKETEEARLATAKIQEKLAPRALSDGQRERIAEKLKQFAGTEFRASMTLNDLEAKDLLYTMLEVFRDAGWILQNPGRSSSVVIRTPQGSVGVTIEPGIYLHAPPTLERLASEVSNIFLAEGLKVEVKVATTVDNTNPERMHIKIGAKPRF